LLFNTYILACYYVRIVGSLLCVPLGLKNSPFSWGEPNPVPLNYNNKAQGPCFSLGLDTVQKETLTRCNIKKVTITLSIVFYFYKTSTSIFFYYICISTNISFYNFLYVCLIFFSRDDLYSSNFG